MYIPCLTISWNYYTALDSTWWGEAECAKGIFLFSCRDKFGFASAKTGEIVIEPQFNKSTWMIPYPDENGESRACANVWKDKYKCMKYGILSDFLEVTVPAVLDRHPEKIDIFGGNRSYFYLIRSHKWGAVDECGLVLREPKYTKREVDIWIEERSSTDIKGYARKQLSEPRRKE